MALVDEIRITTKDRLSVHAATECSAVIVQVGSQRLIQLDKYGSDQRKLKQKVSQSIQFTEHAAVQLLQLIKETFPHL